MLDQRWLSRSRGQCGGTGVAGRGLALSRGGVAGQAQVVVLGNGGGIGGELRRGRKRQHRDGPRFACTKRLPGRGRTRRTLLIENPLCKKVVVVTRRKTDAFADPKVLEAVVNMDQLEEEVAAHTQGVDVALAASGIGRGSANMPEQEVRKIEIAYPLAFCRAAKAGGARVCGFMTAVGADPETRMKYARIIGEKEKAAESVGFDFLAVYRPAVILGNSNTPGVLNYVMPLMH